MIGSFGSYDVYLLSTTDPSNDAAVADQRKRTHMQALVTAYLKNNKRTEVSDALELYDATSVLFALSRQNVHHCNDPRTAGTSAAGIVAFHAGGEGIEVGVHLTSLPCSARYREQHDILVSAFESALRIIASREYTTEGPRSTPADAVMEVAASAEGPAESDHVPDFIMNEWTPDSAPEAHEWIRRLLWDLDERWERSFARDRKPITHELVDTLEAWAKRETKKTIAGSVIDRLVMATRADPGGPDRPGRLYSMCALAIYRCPRSERREAYLIVLYTDADYEGRGYATSALRHATAFLDEYGFRATVPLLACINKVMQSERHRKIYEKVGFQFPKKVRKDGADNVVIFRDPQKLS